MIINHEKIVLKSLFEEIFYQNLLKIFETKK